MYYYFNFFADIKKEDVYEAYMKLKSYSYHDNTDLFLRKRIAEFESEKFSEGNYKRADIDEKIEEIFSALTRMDDESKAEYWDEKINNISYKIVPKNFEDFKNDSDLNSLDNFVSNTKINSKLELDNIVLFFDGSIELQIISVLWCMKLGYLLDIKLEEKCYGNRLIITNNSTDKEKKVTKGFGLFKPYYKQYQKWRDEGIEMAKKIIDNGEDVLFINLDIKNYFYSANVNLDTLRQEFNEILTKYEDLNYLHSIFEKIHLSYTQSVKVIEHPFSYGNKIKSNREVIIPIGLPSSYILANWFLSDFDKRIKYLINPSYYSRYVDDMFVVITNPKINFEDNCEQIKPNTPGIKELSKVDRIIFELFQPLITVENKEQETNSNRKRKTTDTKASEILFKLQCYDNLYIQGSKTLVYYFDHTCTISVLDKFKEEQEKRSSEFRYMPNEALNEKNFDDEAFELIFDGSAGKLRTLKDYKENRYGVSVYFAKRIYSALRKSDVNNDKEIDKILRFFTAEISLDYYRQWEKIFTYFVVSGSQRAFVIFYEKTLTKILNHYNSHSRMKFKDSKLNEKHIYEDLVEFFAISAQLAIALDPTFFKKIKSDINTVNFKHKDKLMKIRPDQNLLDVYSIFRISNLIRHNFVFHPLLNYTNFSEEPETSYINKYLPTDKDSNILLIDDYQKKYSPRKIKFWEACWYVIYKRVIENGETGDPNVKIKTTNILYSTADNEDDNYLNEAFDLYYEVNYWFITHNEDEENNHYNYVKNKIFDANELTPSNVPEKKKIIITEYSVANNKKMNPTLKVALGNIEVDEENYGKSMLGKPNIDNRYEYFSKLLNKVEKEECDLFVMPELCVPYNFVPFHLEFSTRSQKAIITGIEHWTSNNIAYNFIITSLPFEIDGEKDTVPLMRLKNHYAPVEESWIRGFRRVVPKPVPYSYHLYRWRGVYFSVYYCFELGDIIHRTLFRSKVDFLVSCIWNLDINYYASIADSTSRDIHCYYIQVNTRQYGDTRITAPKKTDFKDLVKIKGGKNDVILIEEMEINKLREFQYKNFDLQQESKYFKPTPADYDHDAVRIRQENKSYKDYQRPE